MSFKSAQDARVYVAHLGLHAYSRSFSTGSTSDMLDITVLSNDEYNFIVGQTTGTWQVAGPLDVDATSNGQFDTLADIKAAGTAYPVTYMPLGTDSAVWLIDSIETALDTSASLSGTVDWVASGQANGQIDFNGQILENNTSVTIDTNGSAVDGGAATANGGVAHLHVTAYSSFTSDAIRIEHSVDGATGWSTLASFTTTTAVGSERVTVAAGTTVRRYLRVVDDVTGSGSITRHVTFARR